MVENQEATQPHSARGVRVVAGSSCAAAVPTRPAVVCAEAAAAEPGIRRLWLAVGAVALGAFVLVMTETLPVGLLPQIAGGLHVSLGLAGLMVLVPGFSAAVAAPLSMPLKSVPRSWRVTMPEHRCVELSLFAPRIVARANRGPRPQAQAHRRLITGGNFHTGLADLPGGV